MNDSPVEVACTFGALAVLLLLVGLLDPATYFVYAGAAAVLFVLAGCMLLLGRGPKCRACGKRGAVMWNPYNHVTQCHRCGKVAEWEKIGRRPAGRVREGD